VPAILAQEEAQLSDAWTLLGSARLDFHNIYGTLFTPRLAVMFKPSTSLTLRLGGGSGFKAPTIFTEEAEEHGFQGARLASDAAVERARSGSFDFDWRTAIGDVGLSLNGAAYLTTLDNPLIADADSLAAGVILLRNATGEAYTRGGELSLKLSYEEFRTIFGYTYLWATECDGGNVEEIALNPRHSFGGVVMWESEEAGAKAGFEAYWTGRQKLEDHPSRSESPSYWVLGLLIEKAIGPIRLFINFENFLDTSQTRFEPIVIGNPDLGAVRTLPIYAPLEGRVINGGIRLVIE
jgi:iron complex outermembrane receptor protein